MADRYTYIPLLGIFVFSVWGVADMSEGRSRGQRVLVPAFSAVIVVLVVLTFRQIGYWKSSYELWTHDLQVTGSNYVAEENLAISLADLGRDDEALPHFENAREIRPDDATALLNIGTSLSKHGLHQQAIQEFETVLRTSKQVPQRTAAYRGLGVAYSELGDRTQARANFMSAYQLSPDEGSEIYNLSMLEVEDGIDRLSKVLSVHPKAQGYLDLGRLLQQDRKPAAAKSAYEKALELNPKLTEAVQALRDMGDSR
jgi:tetratricopeptide (TPR) repeat protein